MTPDPISFAASGRAWWQNKFNQAAQTRPVLAALVLALVAWVLTTFLAAPAIWMIKEGRFPQGRDVDFLALCHHPTERALAEPLLAYRMTTPLVAYVLGLPGYWPFALQYLALIGLYMATFTAVKRRTDATTAAWSTLLVALNFTTIWANTHDGVPDSVTHLAAALCLLSARPGVLVPAAFFGLLNDERFVLAAPFIVLWHVFPGSAPGERHPATQGKVLLVVGVSLFAGLLAWLLFRYALRVGLIGPGISPHAYDTDFSDSRRWLKRLLSWPFPCNVLLSWRWAWWLPVATLVGRGVPGWQRTGFVTFLAGGCLVSGKVGDVARSIGFLFPAFLLAVVWLRVGDFPQLKSRLALTVLACVLTPVLYLVDDGGPRWIRPLPVAVARYLKAVPLPQTQKSSQVPLPPSGPP